MCVCAGMSAGIFAFVGEGAADGKEGAGGMEAEGCVLAAADLI